MMCNFGLFFKDLFKTFDRVWHDDPISKSQTFGLPAESLQSLLFIRYVSDIFQNIMYKDLISLSLNTYAGIPHGSVSGPSLFLTYVNDLLRICYQWFYSNECAPACFR